MLHQLVALALYLHHTATDGDYLNDWLTHLPAELAAQALTVGRIIAAYCGC